MENHKFIFTTENLLDNLDKIGGWSIYALASSALQHYFPDEYDEDGQCETSKEVGLCHKLGCDCWQDVIIKYHKEVGYEMPFAPEFVNEH